METLNLGVIGLGEIGQAHCSSITQIERAKIVAVSDVKETILNQTAEQYGVEPYTDYKKMLAHPGLDAVVVALPDPTRRDACVLAAEAGKHILVEKPIAMSVEDSDAIIQAADKARVKLMVGFTVRYFPRYMHAKQVVAQGGLGDVVSVFARRVNVITQPDCIKGRTG
jgi:UDP-N-acetylglucosamine 3-dehydrogenase